MRTPESSRVYPPPFSRRNPRAEPTFDMIPTRRQNGYGEAHRVCIASAAPP